MSAPMVVGLMLVAGLFHAGWNLLAKRLESDHLLFLTAVSPFAFLMTAPWAAFHLPEPRVLLPAAGYVVLRVILNSLYLIGLVRAYRSLDLSVAYPLARGTGPLVAVVLAVLLLGERPSVLGVVGVLVVSAAIWSLGATSGVASRAMVDAPGAARAGATLRAVMWPLLTGVVIGCYTVLDKAALSVLDPVTYFSLIELGTALLLGGLALARGRLPTLRGVVRVHWRQLVGCAALVTGSYALALIALAHTYASCVAPLREVAVLYGVLFGVVILREPHGWRRIPSAVGMAAGLVMVGIAI